MRPYGDLNVSYYENWVPSFGFLRSSIREFKNRLRSLKDNFIKFQGKQNNRTDKVEILPGNCQEERGWREKLSIRHDGQKQWESPECQRK